MTILKIYHYPEPVLRAETKPVTIFDEEFAALSKDMADTMYDAPGIGLAAPQIGKSLKLIVVDISNKEEEGAKQEYMVMANPEIVEHEGNQIDEEGCLSCPEITAKVKRYQKITVNYQNETGEDMSLTTEGRFAVVLQHEIDHLGGVLFIDHLSTLKRNLYKKKVKKILGQ